MGRNQVDPDPVLTHSDFDWCDFHQIISWDFIEGLQFRRLEFHHTPDEGKLNLHIYTPRENNSSPPRSHSRNRAEMNTLLNTFSARF